MYNIFSQNIYKNEEFHYSFVIPNNWRQIPKNEIDNQMRKLSELTGAKFVNFSTGFQPVKLNLNQYPHLLIQQFEYTISWQEFLSLFGKNFNYDDIEDGLKKIMGEFITKEPIINEEKHAIILNTETYVEGIGDLRATTFTILGKKSFIQFNITVLKKDYDKYISDIMTIIDTIDFEENYKYNIQSNTQKKIKSVSNNEIINETLNAGKRGLFSSIGIIIFLLPLFIIYGIIKYLKKKK